VGAITCNEIEECLSGKSWTGNFNLKGVDGWPEAVEIELCRLINVQYFTLDGHALDLYSCSLIAYHKKKVLSIITSIKYDASDI